MSITEDELHLLPFIKFNDLTADSSSSDDDDDDVEVRSSFDEENELINMSTFLHISSTEKSDIDSDDQSSSVLAPNGRCSESDSDNEANPVDNSTSTVSSVVVSPRLQSTTLVNSDQSDASGTPKRKRRQWSTAEKLKALATYESNTSRHRTAVEHGCTTAQLREWEKNKSQLIELLKRSKG